MRTCLTDWQSDAIKQAARRALGRPARVWPFGSSADDTQGGGDIDLSFETDAVLDNRAEAICRLYAALIMALGDRKIDVPLKDARTPDIPVFHAARRKGVLL